MQRRVAGLVQRKTLTRIFDPTYHHFATSKKGNFHILARVKMAAVFHGVEKNLAEREYYIVLFLFGQSGPSPQELHQAIGSGQIAANDQPNPGGCRGDNLDAVI